MDISQGQDRTPLWILNRLCWLVPLSCDCATDHLLQLIFKGQHGIVQEKAGEGTDYGKPVNYHSVFICSFYSARNGVWVGLASWVLLGWVWNYSHLGRLGM